MIPDEPVVTPDIQSELAAPQKERWVELIKAFGAWLGSIALLLFVPLIIILPYFIYLAVSTRAP
ncbi:MAG TPA: hypothetical protein VLE19_08345, partial [Pyrinomonadaceae bacterium]|nr:hypothetical protein [Pyrinomonadaceae bacterium]